MMLTVDGHDKGVFLTGIDSRTPLWVMVDIYGNSTAVQFVGKSSRFFFVYRRRFHFQFLFSPFRSARQFE